MKVDGGFGLVLPHFGQHATRLNILEGARLAERYGFASVWVRDHLIFHPPSLEGSDRTHIEPFTVLAAVAAATERLMLGTASLIPYRHPIHAALLLGSLDRLAGPGRVIAGWGIGTYDHEFEAIDLGGVKRPDLLREQVDIIRRLLSGEAVSHDGAYYGFTDVDIHPTPSSGGVPIWYCGDSQLAVRKAVEYCDGWMPGRLPIKTLRKRMERLDELSAEAGRVSRPTTGVIPIVSPGPTRESALSAVDWRAMLEGASNSKWELPDSGAWTTPDDLGGALIAGSAEEIAEWVHRYREAGVNHVVFDLRHRFDGWLEHIAFLGEEVLPKLGAA